MIIETVVTSFTVGKIRKRKIMNIADTEIKSWYLFIIAVFIEISANLLVAYNNSFFSNAVQNNFIFIHFFTYMLVSICIFRNRDKKSMWIIFAGTLLNFLCIMANGGQMPISLEALKTAGLIPEDATTTTLDLTHKLVNSNTNLKFLADIMAFPKQYPRAKVFSIGDLTLAAGVFLFLQDAMKGKESK